MAQPTFNPDLHGRDLSGRFAPTHLRETPAEVIDLLGTRSTHANPEDAVRAIGGTLFDRFEGLMARATVNGPPLAAERFDAVEEDARALAPHVDQEVFDRTMTKVGWACERVSMIEMTPDEEYESVEDLADDVGVSPEMFVSVEQGVAYYDGKSFRLEAISRYESKVHECARELAREELAARTS